jgi:hypothetical protein
MQGPSGDQLSPLEERFARIAARLEQVLSASQSDKVIGPCAIRSDELEQRLDAALGDVAKRSDVEGLRLVEAHVSGLSHEFKSARRHLSRLEAIETHLGRLARREPDERPLDPPQAVISMSAISEISAAVAEHLVNQKLYSTTQLTEHETLEAIREAVAALADRVDAFEQALSGRLRSEGKSIGAAATQSHAASVHVASAEPVTAGSVGGSPATLDDFIAAARRAAWQASNAPADEPPNSRRAKRRPPKAGAPSSGNADTASWTRLRLTMMAALLAAGAGFMTYSVLSGGPAGLVRSGGDQPPSRAGERGSATDASGQLSNISEAETQVRRPAERARSGVAVATGQSVVWRLDRAARGCA